MKTPYQTIVTGLDQLYFTPLIKGETIQNRMETVEVFLKSNGWTWDEYLEELSKEKLTWIPPLSSMS